MATVSTHTGACRAYVKQIKDIEVVQEVRLVQQDEGSTIWTIISAPPFDDEARAPVYEAQLEVLRSLTKPVVGFYTLNVQELPPGTERATVVPVGAKLLWSAEQ